MKRSHLVLAISFTLLTLPLIGDAADTDVIYGSQLMSQQERVEHRNRMRNANSAEEREKIRAQHHKRMQIRAAEKGITLPETPPARGQGKGQGKGKGMGQGKGQGKGMGQGQGKGKGMGYGRN